MTVQAVGPSIQPLHRGLRAARRRLWYQRGILLVARSLCLALALALAAALLAAWQAPEPVRQALWGSAAAAIVAGLVGALLMRPSTSQAARAVDFRLGLFQQLGTAEELLARGADGRLASIQIARAAHLAGQLQVSRAFPLLPRRELLLALVLAAFTALLLTLVSMGLTLPNPLSAVRLPSFSREAPSAAQQDPFGSLKQQEQRKPRSAAMEPVGRILDELQRQSQRGAMTPLAASAALSQASAELNRVANESRIRQEALDNLANELRGTATGREVAESLRQGNYDRAAQQLRELGRKSDQLSTSARQELADALNRAAINSQEARELSSSESEAAQALEKANYSSTVESMDKLAQSVQNSANQLVPQNELADAWKRLEQLNRQLGQQGAQKDQNRGALSPPVAQGAQGAERKADLQGAQGDQQAQAAGQEGAGADMPGGQPSVGSPGNARGGSPLGNENPRLGPDGKPLDVEGKIGDRFPGEPGSDSQSPSVMREGTGSPISSGSGGGASGPISVPAENVFVPGDRRPTVRDYFSRATGGQ